MKVHFGLTSLPVYRVSLVMPSCPPQTVPPAYHYPPHLSDRQLRLDPPAVSISFVLPGAQSGIASGSPASASEGQISENTA